jgi:hypothetical protein
MRYCNLSAFIELRNAFLPAPPIFGIAIRKDHLHRIAEKTNFAPVCVLQKFAPRIRADAREEARFRSPRFPRIRASADSLMMATWGGHGPYRVSTVVLHRPNLVVREMPGFIGFFARRD